MLFIESQILRLLKVFSKDKILHELDSFESQSGLCFPHSQSKKYIIPKSESEYCEFSHNHLDNQDFNSLSLNDTNYLEKENSFKGLVKNAIESINKVEFQKVVLSENFELQFNSENILDVLTEC